jgi:two-component sensor histidine kinase
MSLGSFTKKIVAFGLIEGQTFQDRRRIKTLNILNVVVILSLLMGATNGIILKSNYPIWVELLFTALCFVSLVLNKYNKTLASFIVFTFNINLSVFFVNKYYPPEAGTILFYFPLILSIALLQNPSKIDKYSLFHIGFCLLSFFFSEFVDIPQIRNPNFTPENIKLLWKYDLVFAVLCTMVLSVLLTKLIHDQNREVMENLHEQKRSKEELGILVKQKEVLLAELHHRVKNNLAIISGLLNLQHDNVKNEEARNVIGETKSRIMSMALVHKMLFNNPTIKNIHLPHYIHQLVNELFHSYNLAYKVKLVEDYQEVEIPVNNIIPLGLIMNEIITNCIKYAFCPKGSNNPQLTIILKKDEQNAKLCFSDSGPGFKASVLDNTETTSLGISLINSLTEQIEGKVIFLNDNGAKIELEFPLR